MTEAPHRTKSAGYLRLLLVVLGTATFFEGYDTAIAAVALRDLANTFGIPTTHTANITGPIIPVGLGALGALALTMLGDRIGRRPLLIATTFFYTIFTGLTAASPNLLAFVVFQFFARTFLLAEYATAITMIAEEFPASRRGRALGTLTALGAAGLPIVAILHLRMGIGWRGLYLVGLLPLIGVGFLRLRLKETDRWTKAHAEPIAVDASAIRQLFTGEHKALTLKVGALYLFTHFALLGAVAWFPFYAEDRLKLSDDAISTLLAVAYPLGISGYYLAGRLADRIGRRKTGAIFLVMGMVFGIVVFQVRTFTLLFPALTGAVFFGFGVNPVLAAVASELFPTGIRATALGVARSIFGTFGSISGPIVVGVLSDPRTAARLPGVPLLGNMGNVVCLVVLMYIPAALMLKTLPETANLELDSVPVH